MRLFISALLVLLVVNRILSQENGALFMRNYLPKEYGAHIQNWDVVQDKRGVMYFANGDGVLEYDGANYRLIPMPLKTTVRSIGADSAGTIYVGSSNEFGYLQPDDSGKLEYVSLLNLVDSTDRDFKDIWDILIKQDEVYFRSYRKLFRYKNGKLKTWTFEHNTTAQSVFRNKLYVNEHDIGILALENDSFKLAPGGEKFKDLAYFFSLSCDSTSCIVSSYLKGLKIFRFNIKNSTYTLTDFNTEIDDLLHNHRIYDGCKMFDSSFALGTDDGLMILNKSGKLVHKIDESKGLQNQSVHETYVDNNDNLWLALNNGISKIEVSSPITFWDKSTGLSETPEAIINYQGTIYISTHNGVYYLKDNKINKIPGIIRQCWAFIDFVEPGNPSRHHLLVGASNGLYEIIDFNKVQKISTIVSLYELYQSRKDPRKLYIGTRQGITSMVFKNGKWLSEKVCDEFSYSVRGIAEDDKGDLWLGTFRNGVVRLSFSDSEKQPVVKFYREEAGLPSLKNVLVYHFNNRLIFGTEGGLYKFDETTDKFIPDCSLGEQFCNGSRDVFSFIQNTDGKALISGLQNRTGEIGVVELQDGVYNWYSRPFKIIPEMMVLAFYVEPSGIVWIGGSEGLFRYNPQFDLNKRYGYSTLIREVAVADSVIFYGSYFTIINGKKIVSSVQADTAMPVFPFKKNTFQFKFAATSYINEKSNMFSYILEGFDKKWSAWSVQTNKEYTNLPEGKYVFRVKSKNIIGIEGSEASYRFTILSPWYKKWWAVSSYIVIVVLLFWGLLKFNIYRLQEENEQLEKLVRERTAEIIAQNEEIKLQAEHLKKANSEIEKKNIALKKQNNEIFTQNEEIRQQNEEILTQQDELFKYKNHLEELVGQRTTELVMAKQKAEESDKLKTAFLENVSHELRTPMNAILGYADIIASQNEVYDKEFKIISENLNQLLRTIDNILDLSKLHTKQFNIEKGVLKLNKLFSELKKYAELEIHKKNSPVEFICDIEDNGGDMTVSGDYNALYFMFKHLLDNAIKYTESGRIILDAKKNSNGKVEIIVKDTGIGIRKDEIPYIFNVFRKLENKNKVFRGTGAGLAIVKNIVELHCAEISVDSELGKETRFVITFIK